MIHVLTLNQESLVGLIVACQIQLLNCSRGRNIKTKKKYSILLLDIATNCMLFWSIVLQKCRITSEFLSHVLPLRLLFVFLDNILVNSYQNRHHYEEVLFRDDHN